MAKAKQASARSAGNTSNDSAVRLSGNCGNSIAQDIRLLELLEHAREVGAVLLIPGAVAYVDGLAGAVERREDGAVVIRTAKDHYTIHGS